jgi:hypothetical protein
MGGIHGMVEGQHRDPGGEDDPLGARQGVWLEEVITNPVKFFTSL